MAYSVDLRKQVINFVNAGHTQEKGSLEKKPLNREPSVFESEKLNAYIEANPDALLKDIAQHFGGSITGAFYALEREKITYKKRDFL